MESQEGQDLESSRHRFDETFQRQVEGKIASRFQYLDVSMILLRRNDGKSRGKEDLVSSARFLANIPTSRERENFSRFHDRQRTAGRWKVNEKEDLESSCRTFQRQGDVKKEKKYFYYSKNYCFSMNPIIEYGSYYHIFNRGNNHENIFTEEEDYLHFLDRMDLYITPIAEIYAWALLRNHFHLLVRIKEEEEIGYFNSQHAKSENPDLKWKTYFPETPDERFVIKPKPIEQFKHFFNAYSRWFNKRHERTGSLFQKNYERREITSERYFTNLVVYIHGNAVKHGFVEHIDDYPWTSYRIIKTTKPTNINRNVVLSYFDGVENFIATHRMSLDAIEENIGELIIE
ncbi:MAG TPA: hypothetical protein PLE67_14010 [Tenuifilaceae bacterium]|nr:hypothetical protein [Tenuifilaceae bacterium]